MKKHLLRISMLAALAAGVSQAQSAQLTADVPFQFTLGSHTLPAGAYRVAPSVNTHVVTIQSPADQAVPVLSISATSARRQKMSKLVFHRYGNHYFLAEIWTSGADSGWQIPQSNLERELAAQKTTPRTQILVALR
jgi:hypothetical protein